MRSPLTTGSPAPAWLADETNLLGGDAPACPLFEEQLRAQFAAAARSGRPLSLLVLEPRGDCDFFVDALVGLALVDAPEGASAFAIGDGRFALLLPGAEMAIALALARTLELRLAFLSEVTRVWVGTATVTADTKSAEELFARADLAMLEAKMLAGTRIVSFGRAMSEEADRTDAALTRLLADVAGEEAHGDQ